MSLENNQQEPQWFTENEIQITERVLMTLCSNRRLMGLPTLRGILDNGTILFSPVKYVMMHKFTHHLVIKNEKFEKSRKNKRQSN
jgi:hypothetical protein